MRDTRAAERVIVWQLCDELRTEVRKLTKSERLYFDRRMRTQIDDAAGEVGHNVEKAIASDHPAEFARSVRLARSAVNDVQAGLRMAAMKRYLTQADLRKVSELLARLYPALSSLLVEKTHKEFPAHARTD
jgi:four helix bundle protein